MTMEPDNNDASVSDDEWSALVDGLGDFEITDEDLTSFLDGTSTTSVARSDETDSDDSELEIHDPFMLDAVAENHKRELIRLLALDVYQKFFEVGPENIGLVKDWLVRQITSIEDESSSLRQMFGDDESVIATINEIGANHINDILKMAVSFGDTESTVSESVSVSVAQAFFASVAEQQRELLQQREAIQASAAAKAKGIKTLVLGQD